VPGGTEIEGKETIPQAGARILHYVIGVASVKIESATVRHVQDDFIP
jgi:altronate hydrolase